MNIFIVYEKKLSTLLPRHFTIFPANFMSFRSNLDKSCNFFLSSMSLSLVVLPALRKAVKKEVVKHRLTNEILNFNTQGRQALLCIKSQFSSD